MPAFDNKFPSPIDGFLLEIIEKALAYFGRSHKSCSPPTAKRLFGAADAFPQAHTRGHLGFDADDNLVEHLPVLAQEILRGLPTLADLLAVERQPRALLLD